MNPVEIEARQWDGSAAEMHHIIAWVLENGGRASVASGYLHQGPDVIRIETLEGGLTVMPHDYIVMGVNGVFYPCKPNDFEETYVQVGD